MPKLIDAEKAKDALRILARSEASYGTIERAIKALDALPDASEKSQQAGDGAED